MGCHFNMILKGEELLQRRSWLLSNGWEYIAEAWCKGKYVMFTSREAYIVQKRLEEDEVNEGEAGTY